MSEPLRTDDPDSTNDRTLCIVVQPDYGDLFSAKTCSGKFLVRSREPVRDSAIVFLRNGSPPSTELRITFEHESRTEITTLIEASQTYTSGGTGERHFPAPAQPSAEEDEPAIDLTVERLVDGALIILRDRPDADGLIEVRSFTRGLICWSRNPYLALACALTDVGYADTFTITPIWIIARRDKEAACDSAGNGAIR